MSPSGDLFVSDAAGTIRRVGTSGAVTTVAGTAGWSGICDGSGPAVVFSLPTAMTFTPSGDLFITDTGNSVIRRMTPDGQVSVFAGNPMSTGSSDGMGLAARFAYPQGIDSDSAGNLYVADTQNLTLRRVTPLGAVSTWAGIPGVSGQADGPCASATFNWPSHLKRDAFGNTYVTNDMDNAIRKISSSGQVSTIGQGLRGASALACDPSGNLYVVCRGPLLVVRKFTPTGQSSVVLARNTLDSMAPGLFPSSVVDIRDLLFDSGYLYLLADNALLKAGPFS